MKIMRTTCGLLVALALAGCDRETTDTKLPEFRPDATSISFEACPSPRTGSGDPFNPSEDAAVFPDQRTVVVSNLGLGAGTLVPVLEGPGAQFFKLLDPPPSIPATSDETLVLRFSPAEAGTVNASLKLDDGLDETAPVTVALVGTGSNLPVDPTIVAAIERVGEPGEFDECQEGIFCAANFPGTFYGQETHVRVRISNRGCPTLKITGAEVVPSTFTGSDVAFYLDAPAQPPSALQPIQVDATGATTEFLFDLRFSPQPDTENPGEPMRFATLKLATNDPLRPIFEIELAGESLEPALSVSPSYCDVTAQVNACGAVLQNGQATGTFVLRNDGNTPITISKAALRNGGINGRFTVSPPITGQTIPVLGTLEAKIAYRDSPLFVSDVLEVEATAGGQPAGRVTPMVAGGLAPCLQITPDGRLDFQNPTERVSTLPVQLTNGAGCGDLTIKKVNLTGHGAFALVGSTNVEGQTIPAGETRAFNVQYTRPTTGGSQAAELKIETNDPRYPSPGHFLMMVYSDTPPDLVPVADCYVCDANDTGCLNKRRVQTSMRLGELVPPELIIWADESYDPQPDGTRSTEGLTYQFVLASQPGSGATLENERKFTSQNRARLTLGSESSAAQPGTYRLVVYVKDSVGQTSPSCPLTLEIKP